MKGSWIGVFTAKGDETEIDFTEFVEAKKLLMKPFVKLYEKPEGKVCRGYKDGIGRYTTMKDLIGHCGLDCETCGAYIATINDDKSLREKTAKLWSELNNAPILPKHINCEGCRANGAKTVFCEHLCEIRKCALKMGFPTCGCCPELESCPTVGSILENNPSALENLKG